MIMAPCTLDSNNNNDDTDNASDNDELREYDSLRANMQVNKSAYVWTSEYRIVYYWYYGRDYAIMIFFLPLYPAFLLLLF